jgi:predicted nucleic acid-binding protein
METVYLETTIVGYLATDPSRDLLVAAHQQATHEWWNVRRKEFECYISQVVIDEAAAGDTGQAERRLRFLANLPVLEVTVAAQSLAEALLNAGAVPPRSIRDAAHIAVATVSDMDYLLTWNCRHLANAQTLRRISVVCSRQGYRVPVICTPEELMGG